MVLRYFALTLCILAPSLASDVATDGETPIALGDAQQAFHLAEKLSADDGGRLWGRPLYGPMLFVDGGTRFVVANQPDENGLLTESNGVYVGTLPEEENIANTSFRWAGVTWTMMIWPLPENRYARGRLMMHECFHRIQDELELPASNPSNSHLETEAARIWLRLEWRALVEALIRSGDARRRAIEDALLFRAHRHFLIPDGVREEYELEINEGLAEYTGLKLSGLPAAVLADRAALRIERDEPGDSFIRSFAYASGPAYGILLDESDAEWRLGLSSRSDLGALLAAATGVDIPADLAAQAERRAATYEGQAVIAAEADRAELRRLAIERHRQRFFEEPVLLLPLSNAVRYSFNPRAMEALGEMGTVYHTTRVTDEWGILEVTGGALLSRGADGMLAEARVPAPNDATGRSIKGDGWTLDLSDGWRIVTGSRPGDYTVGLHD
jgi:hypothetical protein